eukprot:g62.t1
MDFVESKQHSRIIDFCAGNGRLSQTLQEVLETQKNDNFDFVLVDRVKSRGAVEKKKNMKRITCDIADLQLSKVEHPVDKHNLCGMGKHLCGEAADLALRCVLNAQSDLHHKMVGIAFALCCHHLCSWNEIVDQPKFQEFGIGEREFAIMKRCCAKYRNHPFKLSEKDAGKVHNVEKYKNMSNRCKIATLQAEVGILTKRLVNEVRANWMRSKGFKVKLIRYIDERITPENQLLIAQKTL